VEVRSENKSGKKPGFLPWNVYQAEISSRPNNLTWCLFII